MRHFFSILVVCIIAAGCTTMESIQSKPPSYTINYSGVDRAALIACVVGRFDKKLGYVNKVTEGTEYSSIESYVPAYVPAGGVFVEAGGVPYFATRLYDDRVEVYGRYSIWGDHGKVIIPIVEECVSSLGGTSTERASADS